MKQTLGLKNIIISSGGTVTPIDRMRVITNKSGGVTGAKLAEDFIQNGQPITYVATGKSVFPFVREVQINPLSTSPETIVQKIAYLQENIKTGTLKILKAPYFQDYERIMTEEAQKSEPGDVAILSAAVSDFGMKEVVDGKISSSKAELTLELSPLPKVINEMRRVSESLVMIGFKLLPAMESEQKTREALIESALKQMNGVSKTDAVVANASYAKLGDPYMRIGNTMLVLPDGSYVDVARHELSQKLLSIIPTLIKKRIG